MLDTNSGKRTGFTETTLDDMIRDSEMTLLAKTVKSMYVQRQVNEYLWTNAMPVGSNSSLMNFLLDLYHRIQDELVDEWEFHCMEDRKWIVDSCQDCPLPN